MLCNDIGPLYAQAINQKSQPEKEYAIALDGRGTKREDTA
jgi:hypothetical protein